MLSGLPLKLKEAVSVTEIVALLTDALKERVFKSRFLLQEKRNPATSRIEYILLDIVFFLNVTYRNYQPGFCVTFLFTDISAAGIGNNRCLCETFLPPVAA